MIERFKGSDGERLLRRALLDQVVVGHDDLVAGQLLAVAVLQELVGPDALDAERLSMAAWGQWRPVATNDTEPGRAKNRRVEVEVVGTRAKK